MDVVLIRHPLPKVAASTCYGATDLPLAGDAGEAAVAIRERLREAGLVRPASLVTSPLVRCASVAARLAEPWGLPVSTDARLREIDFGAWEGRSWEAIGRPALERWQADLMGAREHGGESAAQFVARVVPFATSLVPEGLPAVCVTHAGVIRALASHWLDVPLAQWLARPIAFGGLVGFVREGAHWRLSRWDETLA